MSKISFTQAMELLVRWKNRSNRVQVGFVPVATPGGSPITFSLNGHVAVAEASGVVVLACNSSCNLHLILKDCHFISNTPDEIPSTASSEERLVFNADMELILEVTFPTGEKCLFCAFRAIN
jgi:hypothetical protein